MVQLSSNLRSLFIQSGEKGIIEGSWSSVLGSNPKAVP